MGREIRRVPEGWQHPVNDRGHFIALYDREYDAVAEQWVADCAAWSRGEHEEQKKYHDTPKFFWDWQAPPDAKCYRPKYDGPATHFQVYETVSEGTPCSPVFASLEAMIEWMVMPIDRASPYNRGQDWQCMQGMTREQAERFCKEGSCCSLMGGPGIGIVAGHRYEPNAKAEGR